LDPANLFCGSHTMLRITSLLLTNLLLSGTTAFVPNANNHQQKPQTSRIPTELPVTGIKDPNNKVEYPAQISPTDAQVGAWLQSYGEESRKYRRSYFSAGDWVRTRRPDRFVNNLATTFQSGLIRQLSIELPVITATAAFVCLYNDLFIEGWSDIYGIHHAKLINIGLPALQIPFAPFSLPVAALGLLLTFRTNVSYQRWNEARTAWGKVINDSRSICRMGCTWARQYENIDDAKLQRLGETVCSFSRTLQNRLLTFQEDEADYKKYCRTWLTDQNYADKLYNAKHRPTAALAEITSCLVDLNLNPIHQVEVEKPITGLCDALGASERIFTSPVPTFYTRHTARFLAFWLLSMPMALYEPFKVTWNHWGMIPATVVISGFLLGIEELATQMEEPFSILPMEKMCEGSIRTPVMEQVERSKRDL